MKTITAFFGGQTKAEKQAAASAKAAQLAAARSAEQQAAQAASTQNPADRIARGRGRGVLSFMGSDTGVLSPTLGG